MRLLTIISGGMLIMTSLFCFANTGETFLALAFVLGLAMILTGFVVANFSIKTLAKVKRIYLASILRLIVLPIIFVLVLKSI